MSRHWHPVPRIYISPLTISRTSHSPFVAAAFSGGYQRCDHSPFLIRQVVSIARALAVMSATGLWGPHNAPREAVLCREFHTEFEPVNPRTQTTLTTRFDPGQTLRGAYPARPLHRRAGHIGHCMCANACLWVSVARHHPRHRRNQLPVVGTGPASGMHSIFRALPLTCIGMK